MGHNRPTHNKMLKRRRQKAATKKQLALKAKRTKKLRNAKQD